MNLTTLDPRYALDCAEAMPPKRQQGSDVISEYIEYVDICQLYVHSLYLISGRTN